MLLIDLEFFLFLNLGMILILIFAEALGLYGLIVGIILSQQVCDCNSHSIRMTTQCDHCTNTRILMQCK